MTNETLELKPCPFCGRDIVIVRIGGGWFWKHKTPEPSIDVFELQRDDCPIRWNHKYETKEEAIETWNTRHEAPSEPKAAIKPLLITGGNSNAATT